MTLIRTIGVIGGSEAEPDLYNEALEIGRRLAGFNLPVLNGGGSGIMEAVSRGVYENGGITVGILPEGRELCNQFITVPVSTGMGIGRNIIIVRSADIIIAIGGSYGTLSELAYSAQLEKTVICYKCRFSSTVPCVEARNVDDVIELIRREYDNI